MFNQEDLGLDEMIWAVKMSQCKINLPTNYSCMPDCAASAAAVDQEMTQEVETQPQA